MLESLKASTEKSHAVLHARLDGFEIRLEDLAILVHVENLIEDEDSPVVSPTDTNGKRKQVTVDELGDETLEMARSRLHRVEEKDVHIDL
ncbi:hypothetical protein K7X08_035846 [Anisodus acutangulus]|uniref:Uncharacterized protein n=1 Tax=Anisodus acutangulus TaxID=402998 RepID=A0A9Q1L7I7_9SOLA|nr:hypothetical protein K7X08_035846 [Anisodus acutangulus]